MILLGKALILFLGVAFVAGECDEAMGMQSGKIEDSNLKSSSEWSSTYKASQGRLNHETTYIAKTRNQGQWIQVDFGKIVKVTKIATQGRYNIRQWITKYSVSYSQDCGFFEYQRDKKTTNPREYEANKDNFAVVVNTLNQPIIARCIRIHPIAWYGHISFRFEMYGCFSGFEIPKLKCASPLGIKDGKIPDSALVASSRYSKKWGPEQARLNQESNGGWISQYRDTNQFLQIDMGHVTKVTGISIQGRYDAASWTKTFILSYSNDGATFKEYGKVFQGNMDNTNIQSLSLSTPFIGRFVKINVKTYHSWPSLRVELYGCTKGFSAPNLPKCMDPLGMQSGTIPNSAITASSSYNANSFAPYVGRLHFLSADSGKYGGWAARTNDVFQWFQVDFGRWTQVTAIDTQGRQDDNQWVTNFSLSFSNDGFFYETVSDPRTKRKKIFVANSDRYTVVMNELEKPIVTRYIKIHPVLWYRHISLRAEFLGCKTGFKIPNVVCTDSLGMVSGKILDSALTSSSDYNQYSRAERGRLNKTRDGNLYGGWASKYADVGQWLQIDLGKIVKITRIATQGRSDANWWVRKYILSYSDGTRFKYYKNGEDFFGNTDRDTAEGRVINPPIIARFIRVHPTLWYGHISMRLEVYGCREGFTPGEKEKCMSILGMQNNQIPDSAISASTYYSNMEPGNGRLHFQAIPRKYGAWGSPKTDIYQWFQVDFGKFIKVTGLATQGRQDGAWWVKTYSLSFSYDGTFFEDYAENNNVKKVFAGNTDRYTVVTHDLENPIVTKFIRILPITWQSRIALRAEFYGCKKGFTPPVIKCKAPLGVETGSVPNTAIVASSMVNEDWGPEKGRLQTEKHDNILKGWAAKFNDANQFIQFDLGDVAKVTGVATQGRSDADWMVTSYTLAHSLDGVNFTPYGGKNAKIFLGNANERNEIISNIIDPAIITRFIQIRVKTVRGHPALRAEFYGCTGGFTKPKPLVCLEALGMQNGKIPDSSIKASTEYSSSFKAFNGRLHFLPRPGRSGAWAARTKDVYQYLQVNFGDWRKVTRVVTQGRSNYNQWVKSYSLSYGYDNVFFKDYKEDGSKKIFSGNEDRSTPVGHDLKNPIITRYIRIHPVTWYSHISTRAEFYGCRDGFVPPKLECQSTLGMKDKAVIPDNAITASSSLNQFYGPERARLELRKSGRYAGAWIPKYPDIGQWIQVDLGKVTKITRIAHQGRNEVSQYVKRFTLSYSIEGGPFLPYNEEQALTGNKDSDTIVGNILDPPIIARYLRLHPKEYYSYKAIRFDLYGCTDGFPLPQTPTCQMSLGMQNGKLPNSAITASSQLNSYYGPENARLHFHPQSGRNGAWIPKAQDHNQWLQVDFGNETTVTRVETQGRQDRIHWVNEYTLRYSLDGHYFEHYQPNGYTKSFKANDDRYTVVGHDLNPPIKARFVRIIPEKWQTYIAMRAEFYGCHTTNAGNCASNRTFGEGCTHVLCRENVVSLTAISSDRRFHRTKDPIAHIFSILWFGKVILRDSKTKSFPSICYDRQEEVVVVTASFVTDDGGYSDWSPWSQCSVTCGKGSRSRGRTCTNPSPSLGGKDCSELGPEKETGECNKGKCPVNGGYSEWGPYGPCTKTCGGGEQTRQRTCTNPPPDAGGEDCSKLGPSAQTRECNNQKCPVDGGYTSWEDWSDCSFSCGGGKRRRSRKCTNPVPQYGGKDCSSLGPSDETEDCNTNLCPVNGGYSVWGPYGTCSKSCGGGTQTRRRTCTDPPPVAGGKDCSDLGASTQTRECNNQKCPVDGGYTEWGDWSDCSFSCGGGQRLRSRKCTNPVPSDGGKDCSRLGPAIKTEECNKQGCPVDGGYGSWGNWGDCSVSCGKGKGGKSRERLCNNPAPANRGKDCTVLNKNHIQTSSCTGPLKTCPMDGKWSNWSSWGACSVTCGGGSQTRTRDCNNPKPKGGGKECIGEKEETRQCNAFKCGPEWKPIGCFKNAVRALDVLLKRVGSKPSIGSRYSACEAAADETGATLIGLDDERCWTSQDPYASYSKYGASNQCKENKDALGNGLAEYGTVSVYQKDEEGTWVSKGCYVNMSPERALGKSIDNNVESTQGNNNIFYYCVKKAEIFGYKIFGADNKNCWVGDDAETTYDKFGGSSKCSISKSGYGSGTALYADMFVYRYEE